MAYEVRRLCKSYGSLRVLDGLSLTFDPARITVVLGPSGCGKTSLLTIMAGLDADFSGELHGFQAGSMSYVFQEDRLLPWLSARENVAFALRSVMEPALASAVAGDALRAVGLADHVESRPAALSGGMRRRVALARAFAYPSEMLLLDEPFSSLDLRTRIAVMDLFLGLRASDGRGAIVVTHDVREAIYLGDRIVTLSEKPAVTVDDFEVHLARQERSFSSGTAADLEARLYASILAPGRREEA